MKTFLNFLIMVLAVIKSFFKKYHELITIPVGFAIWMLSVHVLRWMDPTAAVFDAGVFQVPIFAIIQFIIYVAIAWIILGIVFGTFQKYLKFNMKTDFENIQPWQKLKLTYSAFFFLLAVLAYLAKTLVAN
jgi:hypothetical protein